MKIKEFLPGISISILISLIAWYLGNLFPIIGGPVIGLFIGLLLASLLINQERFNPNPRRTTAYCNTFFDVNCIPIINLS